MQTFDHDYAETLIERLRALPKDTKPQWGTLTPAGMVRHLTNLVRYSMGRAGKRPFTGNWFSRRIIGPLIVNGFMPMPKNVKVRGQDMGLDHLAPLAGEVETFHAVIEEYLDAVQSGAIRPEIHPYFGDLGVDGWAKCHVVHIEHHMRQFGA
jgi:Protein of unknown function (DUF1569)